MKQQEQRSAAYEEPTNIDKSRFDFFKKATFLQQAKDIYEKRLEAKAKKENLKETAMIAIFIFGFLATCIFVNNAEFDVFRFINTLPRYVVYITLALGWLCAWIDRKRRIDEWNIKRAAMSGEIYKGCRIKEYRVYGETQYHRIELDAQTLSRLQIEEHRQAIYEIEAELKIKVQNGMQFKK